MDKPRIGSLRWRVVIAQRRETPDPASAGILETLVDLQEVHADIEPVGTQTFYGSAQVDTPITHRIRIRWLDWVDTTHVLKRRTLRRDGTAREELFRVRRVGEFDGRKEFLLIDAELETRG